MSLYEVDEFDQALQAVRQDVGFAALTRGPKGSVVVKGDEVHVIDAVPPSQVLDTTGAGDLYAAGFLRGLTAGFGLANAAIWARLRQPRSSASTAHARRSRCCRSTSASSRRADRLGRQPVSWRPSRRRLAVRPASRPDRVASVGHRGKRAFAGRCQGEHARPVVVGRTGDEKLVEMGSDRGQLARRRCSRGVRADPLSCREGHRMAGPLTDRRCHLDIEVAKRDLEGAAHGGALVDSVRYQQAGRASVAGALHVADALQRPGRGAKIDGRGRDGNDHGVGEVEHRVYAMIELRWHVDDHAGIAVRKREQLIGPGVWIAPAQRHGFDDQRFGAAAIGGLEPSSCRALRISIDKQCLLPRCGGEAGEIDGERAFASAAL